MGISLGPNRYGKAESRVVRIYRDSPRHEIVDLNVSTSLRGDFNDAHITGDQSGVLPTDTQKNTAFAYAKSHGISSPEDYAIALARRFLEAAAQAHSAQIGVEQYAWDRIPVGPSGHDHAFVKRGGAVRTTVVTVSGRGEHERVWVVSGLQDLVLLKSTGSEFRGYLKDEYTTLPEADDRILATSLVARWRYAHADADWSGRHAAIHASLLETFATTHSHALQESLYQMGKQVLESFDDVAEIRFSAPNKHHFLVDLSPFGLSNEGEVFIAADRPYGLIEAAVTRDDAPDPGEAWLPAFI
ncbi:MAG TPA: urate oxidase [Solirubrobacteraceae bacterium]|nr:urate oxidase [Solirubrobacteraceae bacterium]